MAHIRRLLRFWFTFDTLVTRKEYLRHGVVLMLLKYAGDVSLVAVATGTLWTPLDYLRSVPFLMSTTFVNAPPYLAPALALWTLPFLWIGVTMTMRRLFDAGWSGWLALLFFVPYVSYCAMLGLTLLPSDRRPGVAAPPRPEEPLLPSALMSMALGTALGLGMLVLGVRWLNSYGLALFMGTPFAIGAVTAFFLCRRYPASVWETHEVVTLTILLVGGMAFLLGTEGMVCLLMTVPLAIVIALMGGLAGRFIARQAPGRATPAMVVVLVPLGAVLEAGGDAAELREVVSIVEVSAPPDVVWRGVLAFPTIPEPSTLIFRLGIAYPQHAEIVGEGVGATRYCVFSTGAFVEPITRWEPGRRLSFDVVDSPPPLRELTFYRDLAPPHLEGYLLPRRGEFRLIPLAGGRTRLEGSTWYEQRLRPEGYWVLFSDAIIRSIHRRVLDHVKRHAEEQAAAAAASPE